MWSPFFLVYELPCTDTHTIYMRHVAQDSSASRRVVRGLGGGFSYICIYLCGTTIDMMYGILQPSCSLCVFLPNCLSSP